jgi:hypothetical protein
MATLDIAQAASTIGRPTETIERWILDGTVEAERDDRGWAVDVRSLLNAATADDAAGGANGVSPDHAPAAPAQPTPSTGPETGLATTSPAEPAPPRNGEPTVEIASAAITALSERLEQAMAEIDRLHDERLKLALQLGYAQAQLKSADEQLRALTAPPEPDPLSRLFGWLRRDRV